MNVLFSKIIKNKLALLGGIILFMLSLLIITTPFLNLSDPNAINTSDPGTKPPPSTLSNSLYPLEMRSISWFFVWLISSER